MLVASSGCKCVQRTQTWREINDFCRHRETNPTYSPRDALVRVDDLASSHLKRQSEEAAAQAAAAASAVAAASRVPSPVRTLVAQVDATAANNGDMTFATLDKTPGAEPKKTLKTKPKTKPKLTGREKRERDVCRSPFHSASP